MWFPEGLENTPFKMHAGNYRERAGGIFSMITFLKSVGYTDQNAL